MPNLVERVYVARSSNGGEELRSEQVRNGGGYFAVMSVLPPSCARPLPTPPLVPASIFANAELCCGCSRHLHKHDGFHITDT